MIIYDVSFAQVSREPVIDELVWLVEPLNSVREGECFVSQKFLSSCDIVSGQDKLYQIGVNNTCWEMTYKSDCYKSNLEKLRCKVNPEEVTSIIAGRVPLEPTGRSCQHYHNQQPDNNQEYCPSSIDYLKQANPI